MLSRRKFLQIAAASTGLAITGTDLLAQAVANASTMIRPDGSRGIKHIVILMMENRSFDHFLGWLPGADGRHDLTFVSAVDGNTYPNYPLAPDFQGCGYSDPDHSWEGWLVQHNHGKLDGFLQRPTTPGEQPGRDPRRGEHLPDRLLHQPQSATGRARLVPDLPVIGALAEHYTTLDRYFCSFAGETFPNRFYQHAGQTDRDHNSEVPSTLPTIWDQLSPIPNSNGIPTGGYYYRDSPFLALWASPAIEPGATFKYQAFFHPFSDADASTAALSAGTSFIAACENGTLPNVCYIDPAFDNEGTGTSGRRPPARRHPARRALHRRRLPRPGRQRLPRQHGLHRDVRRMGRLLRPRAAAAGHRRHQPGQRHARRRQHHADRRPALPGLPAARLPGSGPCGHQPRVEPAPGGARGPVRALLEPGADRVHVRIEPADRSRQARAQPRGLLLRHPVPAHRAVRPSSIPASSDVIGPAISPPSESLLAGAHRHRCLRPGRHLHGRQCAVGVACAGEPSTGDPRLRAASPA